MWENVRPFQWKKTVCIQPDICGGYIRFYKTALFHKKPPHGGNHVLHVQHGGASRISGFPASFPAFRPWKKRPGIGAGFRSRLAFLPDFKLVLRLHFPENRSFLPPGPAQFPFRLRVKGFCRRQAFFLPPSGPEGAACQGFTNPAATREAVSAMGRSATVNSAPRRFNSPRQTTSGNSLADDKDVHDRWIKNRKIPEMKEESGGVAVPLPPEERRAAGVPSLRRRKNGPAYRAAMMASPISAVFTRISPGAPVARSPVRQPWSITRRTAESMASAAVFSPRE